MDGVQLFGSSSILIIKWYMYRRLGFFWRESSPRSPEARGDLKNPEGTSPFPTAVGPRAWRGARGEPKQNQKTEIRKRKGKETEKESPRGYFCGDIEDWIFFVGMNCNLLN